MKRDREILKSRYSALYGDAKGEKLAEKDCRKFKRYIIAICILLPLVLVVQYASDIQNQGRIITDSKGRMMAIERPGDEGTYVIDATVTAEKDGKIKSEDKQIIVIQKKEQKKKNEESFMREETPDEKLERKLDSAVREVNQDVSSGKVRLPSRLDDGTKIVWKKKKGNRVMLTIGGFLLLALLIYAGRYQSLKAEERRARESVLRDLPEFINKTVLLLRGGIVLSEAMARAIEDGKNRKDPGYFYDQMALLLGRAMKTNSPIHLELSNLAKRSEVRELMRVSNIINDNISKGSDLTRKLGAESSMLWFARKKQAEEKGRLAETKLTLPLVILILVLVMVTVAPALLEING